MKIDDHIKLLQARIDTWNRAIERQTDAIDSAKHPQDRAAYAANINDLRRSRSDAQERLTQLLADKQLEIVNVAVDTEGGEFIIQVTRAQADRLHTLLEDYQGTGDWPDEVNDIINGAPRIKIETVGTISTYGDGGGWYDNEG
jgi:hypothetical protein